jgi:hypothetical protein
MTSTMTLTIKDYPNSFTVTLNPLPHDSSIMHANIKIHDIWTLKVFVKENDQYEVQIFRNDTNVNDTPFARRTFLQNISEVEQFIAIFKGWSMNHAYISFNDLQFVNDGALITRQNPIFRGIASTLWITRGSHPGYYDISFNDGIGNTRPSFKLTCLEKDDVTHYIRWFAQWVEHFNAINEYGVNTTTSQQLTPDYIWKQYLSWIRSW